MSFFSSNWDLQSAQVRACPSLHKTKQNKSETKNTIPGLLFDPHITACGNQQGHEASTSLKEFHIYVSTL